MNDLTNHLVAIEFWSTRCDDMQVAINTLTDRRDALQEENTKLKEQLKLYSSMVERLRIAMSEGREL